MIRFTQLVSLATLICGVSFLPGRPCLAQVPSTASADAPAPMDCAAIAAEMAAARSQAAGARRHAAFGLARSLFSAAAPSLLGQIGGGSVIGQVAAQTAMGVAQQGAMAQAMDPAAAYATQDRDARLQAMSAARGCSAG